MRKFNLTGAVTPSPKYWWLNDESLTVLNRGYLREGETTEGAIKRITTSAAARLKDPSLQPYFAELVERGWMSLSSPIWANMGTERGLPISCNGVTISDTMNSIISKGAEVRMQTAHGSGTSGYFGKIRPRGSKISKGGKSNGPVHVMEDFESAIKNVSQNGIRRGVFAAYLDIEHPDIMEHLAIRDIGNPIQNLMFGVCISNKWMQEMKDGDKEKRTVWAKVLESRQQKGMPYLFFSDNVNNNKPDIYKELNLTIWASNVCAEISLPASEDESFVCDLSSMNLELYDEWKDTDAVQLATWFLDAVMEEYIEKTEGLPFMSPVNKFAKRHRAVGLG